MFRAALLLGVFSTPVVLGFQIPLSTRIPQSTARSGCVSNRLRMVATPLRTEDQKPNGEEWQGTSTLDRQLVGDLFFCVCFDSTKASEQQCVRIDDEWYDLSRWRRAHPAGNHWIDLYKNQVLILQVSVIVQKFNRFRLATGCYRSYVWISLR